MARSVGGNRARILIDAEKLLAARMDRGVSQERLAEALGVTKGQISHLENGRVKSVTSEAAQQISSFLQTPISELTGQPGLVDETSEQASVDALLDQRLEEWEERLEKRLDQYVSHRIEGRAAEAWSRAKTADSALAAATNFVARTANMSPRRNDRIVISSLGEDVVSSASADQRLVWMRKLKETLSRGWNIEHLVRIDGKQRDLLELVKNVVYLTGCRGTYTAKYVDYPVLDSDDIILIPRVGGLQIPSEPQKTLTPAPKTISMDQESDLHVLREEVEQHLRSGFSLVTSYGSLSEPAFLDEVAEIEGSSGTRYLALNGFSEVTLHPDINRSRADALIDRNPELRQDVERVLRIHKQRWEAFRNQLATSQAYDLCPIGAIERLLAEDTEDRHPEDDPLAALGAPSVTRGQAIAQVREVIDLLSEPNSNYHLGLIAPDLEDRSSHLFSLIDHGTSFWLLKSGEAVILEVFFHDGADKRNVQLDITHHAVVKAFEKWFRNIWNDIPLTTETPDGRAHVINKLEDLLADTELRPDPADHDIFGREPVSR